MSIKKVVFTGGPHSGKSTLVTEFQKRGYPVAHEAAIHIIEDLNRILGIEGQVKFRDEEIDELQELIYHEQMKRERLAMIEAKQKNHDFIIADRGIFDGFAYYRLFNKQPSEKLLNIFKHYHYDATFAFEVLPNFDSREGSGRFEDYELSKTLSQYAFDAYKERSTHTFMLPPISIEDRVNFVVTRLDEIFS